MRIERQLAEIRRRIAAAAGRVGRPCESVRLVAVSKYRTVEEMGRAVRAGVTDIGENRVQEAAQKRRLLGEPGTVWHLVGHLQSNKAKKAVRLFDWIHSVDSLKLAERLDRLAEEQPKRQRVLVQVDLAGEETKAGLATSELLHAVERIGKLAHLSLEGLMVVPPYLPDPEDVRPFFARLRQLRDDIVKQGIAPGPLLQLSMGMTHDFEVAIEEGATMIRLGTALFGERPMTQPALVQTQTQGSGQEEE